MKRWTLEICGLLLLLALPFLGGCDQQAHSAPVSGETSDTSTNPPPGALPNITAPATPAAGESADQELANASGKVISTPENSPPPANANPQLDQVLKLARAGVDKSIVMAYVTNSPGAFNLSPDDIVYLNDLGVSQDVVTAMLQRDQNFNSMAGAAQEPPQATTPPETEAPPSDQNTQAPMVDQSAQAPNAVEPSTETTVTPPLTPPEDVGAETTQDSNGSYTYFYDSLAPYGNWINIDGYGPCWQPTVVVANPGWQPYCNAGNWVYTDCGWCWNSSYSWGWAPFHYGRWFHHSHWGWCWAPDTVWGPAWVSWRYNSGYCGWAPLPPAACYRPGFGFTFYGQSVGFNFTFGLSSSFFVFVPLDHFHEHDVQRFRVPHREVAKFYNNTTLNNRLIHGNNNTLVNTGVPVDRVAAASHMTIQPIHIRAQDREAGSAQLGRDGHTLSVYKPALPLPKPSGNPRLAGEGVAPARNFNLGSRLEHTTATPSNPGRQPAFNNQVGGTVPEQHPVVSNPRVATPRQPAPTPSENPAPPAWRTTPAHADNNGAIQTAPRAPVAQPRTPAPLAQPRTPAPIVQPRTPVPTAPRTYYPPQQSVQPHLYAPQGQQRELQQPAPAPRQEYTPRQEVTPRQEASPPHYEAPRQEAPVRNYEAPRQEAPAHSYEAPRQEAPVQSAPSRQESGPSGNGGNAGGNGWNGGGGGGGGGGGRGR